MWQRTQHRCLVQGISENGKALIFLLVWNGRVKLICDIILGVFLSAELLLGSFFLQLKSHKTFLFSFISIFIIKRHIINAILTFLAETNFGQFSEPYFVLRSSKYFCFSRSEYLFFILDPLLHELTHLLMIILWWAWIFSCHWWEILTTTIYLLYFNQSFVPWGYTWLYHIGAVTFSDHYLFDWYVIAWSAVYFYDIGHCS